jgi:hypothetical protein
MYHEQENPTLNYIFRRLSFCEFSPPHRQPLTKAIGPSSWFLYTGSTLFRRSFPKQRAKKANESEWSSIYMSSGFHGDKIVWNLLGLIAVSIV